MEIPTQLAGSLPQAAQTKATLVAGKGQALAVIADQEGDRVVANRQYQPDLFRRGVFLDVGQGFLGRPVEGEAMGIGQVGHLVWEHAVDGEPGGLFIIGYQPG